ncbi:hypothetical protein D1BOALGB6SA_6230 [Olavius sp. associated proteobacterium Delta 1]|nr:hypothetical protein D1BOALGB6SA_6230 [Olavius sp. associated proteobacterium Delta 1]
MVCRAGRCEAGMSRVKLHESNGIFVNLHTLLQSTDFVVVLVLVLDKILNHEDEHENDDEHEKYQIQSPKSALL